MTVVDIFEDCTPSTCQLTVAKFCSVLVVLGTVDSVALKLIISSCFADNAPAVGLLYKAGFVQEGLRMGAIRKGGRFRDVREFGLLL